MSVFDWLRRTADAVGQVRAASHAADPDPLRREARQLFAALLTEVPPNILPMALTTYPTGRRILRASSPHLQLAILEVAFEEFIPAKFERLQTCSDYMIS